MENFFNPRSVAIFASMKEGKTGYEIVKNMVDGGFKGEIYPINRSGGEIFGRKMYPEFNDLNIDLAVIAIPGQFIPSLLEVLGKIGVKSVVIISAYGSEEKREEAKDRGIYSFLDKPFSGEKILEAIGQFQEKDELNHE